MVMVFPVTVFKLGSNVDEECRKQGVASLSWSASTRASGLGLQVYRT